MASLGDGSLSSSTIPTATETPSHTRYYVLGGALLSSAIFGFPVFCLVCPIGLFFATLFGLMRLLRFNEPTITLVVFPIVLIVEIIVLRKWCSRICPLGALIGLVSRFNRTLRPEVDAGACLATTRGLKCLACRRVCPEDIDPHEGRGQAAQCTKCRDCADNCPAGAIRFPWRKRNGTSATKAVTRPAGDPT
ncbi:4Fe-4S binding protein [Telmatospirillum sp.]|uniref:4Fe-4S binding protein n=1 Tax=Telmatospirillum sp. TaxID=2079197 RepID=UPI002849D73D|nr:4Fe-4S binding protein [Telmatospirillum sp.]MDR3437925.1 4Fe-4S binding protein [Telmatospirillum sp.]